MTPATLELSQINLDTNSASLFSIFNVFRKCNKLRPDRMLSLFRKKCFNVLGYLMLQMFVVFVSCLAPSKCEFFSPLDDLAFDMYQDPEVAHIIRLLDQKKQDMVRQEKYEQAKTLKQAIADLQKVL